MGRLIFLLFAFLVVLYGQSLVAGAESLSPYLLRDSLVLAAVGTLLFAWGAVEPNRGGAMDAPAAASRSSFSGASEISLLLIVILIGGTLRYWAIQILPGQCIGSECTRLVAFADQNSVSEAVPTLTTGLMKSLAAQVEAPAAALRWVGVLVGTISLAAFYLFARQMVRAPSALAATAFVAQSPWHIWSSAVADDRILLPLFIALTGWLTAVAFRTGGLLWLTAAGATLGLLWYDGGILLIIPCLWSLTLLGIGTRALWSRGAKHIFSGMALWVLALLAVLGIGFSLGLIPIYALATPFSNAEQASAAGVTVLSNLFYRGSFGSVGDLVNGSLPGIVLGSLALLGLGVLGRRPSAIANLIVLSGIGVTALGLWLIVASGLPDPVADPISSLTLVLLPFLVVLSAAALNQFLESIQQSWRPLLVPQRIALGVLGVVLLVSAFAARDLFDRLETVTGSTDRPLHGVLTQFLAEALPASAEDDVTFFAPADYLEHPTTGLQIGPAFEAARASGQLRAFDPFQDLLFVTAPAGDLIYLLDGNNRSLIELMLQIFPEGELQPQPMLNSDDSAQLVLFRASMSEVLASRGLTGSYYEGNDPAAAARQPVLVRQQEPLAGEFAEIAVQGPFSLQREGTLLVTRAGNYAFWLQSHPEAHIRMLLDNIPVLDTELDLNQADAVPLARGPYRLLLTYRSEPVERGAQAQEFKIRWRPPDGNEEAIALTLLRTSPPPNMGLLGSYYAGTQFEEPALFMQKDLLVGLSPNLSQPYSVLWRGKLAASRAGEYVLGTLSEGRAALRINEQMLIDAMQSGAQTRSDGEAEADATATDNRSYTEGRVYLTRGWHNIEIAYVPAEDESTVGSTSGLELFWLPPGGSPAQLPMDYLLPIVGGVSLLAYPLPSAPLLASPLLGNDLFALSQVRGEFKRANVTLLPSLPSFHADLRWQSSDGCGSGRNQLADVHGLAFDPRSGEIYVADTGNRRVVTYDLDGTPGQIYESDLFQEPYDIAMQIDSASDFVNPLVLDAVSQQIYRLAVDNLDDESVMPLPIDTSFYRPRGIGTDEVGNIVVADTGGARVVLLTRGGQLMLAVGGRETRFGLGQPVDAVATAGRLWALTAEDGRLWQLTESAEESGSISAAMATNTLNGPRLAALSNGALFITDPVRGQVIFHTPEGQPQFMWADPSLREPVGIDLALLNDQLYMAIADHATCTLSVWSLDGVLFGL